MSALYLFLGRHTNTTMFFVLTLSILIIGVSPNYAAVERRIFSPRYQCGRHEHFVINSRFCQVTCTNRILIEPDNICYPVTGCVCNYRYVRRNPDGTGPCISEDECPPDPIWCGPHEVPTDCEIICPPQTCDSIGITYKCEFDIKFCRKGCNCIDGYLRNSIGICIPRSFCPKPFINYLYYHNDGIFSHKKAISSSSGHETQSSTTTSSSTAPTTSKNLSLATSSRMMVPSTTGRPLPTTTLTTTATTTSPYDKESLDTTPETTESPFSSSANSSVSMTLSDEQLSVSSEELETTTTSSPNDLVYNCTKPNEVWHQCPPACLGEDCCDIGSQLDFCEEEQECNPRCICVENYYRNGSNICVHMDDCPYYEHEY